MTEAKEGRNRQEATRTERRRRDDATLDAGQALKLAVPPEIQQQLTEQGRMPRWVNDDGNRIYRMTKLDDWDIVEGVPPRPVLIDKAKGTTVNAILLSKPIDFVNEDRRKKDAGRRETERAMLEGTVPNAGPIPATRPDNLYLPSDERGGKGPSINKIERGGGNQII